MQDFLRQQLERYAQRLEELNFLLSREDIMGDMKQYRAISREHADVTAIAGRYARHRQREADLAAARDMLSDPDMADMAQEEIASAEAELERTRAGAALARTQDQRARQLVAEHAVSREEADTRAGALAQSAAQVRAAEAALAAARLNLDFTEVRAPVSGRAGRALLTVGNLAQADQSVLTTVVSQDPVYVYFDADEHSFLRQQQAAKDTKGRPGVQRPVRVGLAGDEGFPHAGSLDFTDNQLNAGTGTVRMRARLPNPDRLLTPGLFARVQLQDAQGLGGERQTLLIDDKAVLTDQDRKYVYVVGEGNKAERRDLELGRMVDGRRVVDKGLAAGDSLVVGGLQRIYYPGMPISPKPAPGDGQAAVAKAPAVAAQ